MRRHYHLVLPLPPSPNSYPRNPIYQNAAKKRYQRECWEAACGRFDPVADPPKKVRVDALFHVRNLRDEDNLQASLKWPLDALRQRQRGNLKWRQGYKENCGFYVDDDPAHFELGGVAQAVERNDPCLILWIEEMEE